MVNYVNRKIILDICIFMYSLVTISPMKESNQKDYIIMFYYTTEYFCNQYIVFKISAAEQFEKFNFKVLCILLKINFSFWNLQGTSRHLRN